MLSGRPYLVDTPRCSPTSIAPLEAPNSGSAPREPFRSVGRPTSTAEVSRSSLMNTPRTIRLHADDNIVSRHRPREPGRRAAGLTARERILRGHKMAVVPIARRRADPQVRADHRLCHSAHRAGRMGARAQCRMHDFARDYRFARGRAATTNSCRPSCAPRSRAIARAERQDRHPQLSSASSLR